MFDGVWAGLADGFESLEGEFAAALVGEGGEVGEPGGGGGLGELVKNVEEVLGEFVGERGGVVA